MKKLLKPSLAILIALFAIVAINSCELAVAPPTPVEFDAQSLSSRPHAPYLTHMYTEVSTDTWYILVDLSDTTNYPHAGTNSIILKSLHYAGDLGTATHWDWNVGVVTSIAATTANIEWIMRTPRNRLAQFDGEWTLPEHGLNLAVTGGVLPFVGTIVSPTNAITSGTVLTASAYITAMAEVGDLVLYLDEAADNVEFHFSVCTMYDTE